MLSVIYPKLFEKIPNENSTPKADNIANNEICRTWVRCTNADNLLFLSPTAYYYYRNFQLITE